ncbi:MAG: hypothetical protein PSX37_06960, partial [bacterium]|nr:hypothetical protein [bacterium]
MRQSKPNERGSVYIMVLGVAMLVTIMGVGGMLAVQAQGREVNEAKDSEQAHQGSRAAIELAQFS